MQFFEHDITLGDSVALLRTPGHTEGNHSIVVNTTRGVFVTSENGICADAYAPEHSRIPGLRKWARRTQAEVVLNGNTLEGALDQYLSMVMEKEVAGPSEQLPSFPMLRPHQKWLRHPFSLGLRPSFHVGALRIGAPRTPAGVA